MVAGTVRGSSFLLRGRVGVLRTRSNVTGTGTSEKLGLAFGTGFNLAGATRTFERACHGLLSRRMMKLAFAIPVFS